MSVTVREYVLARRGLGHVTVADDRDLLRAALLALRPDCYDGPRPRWVLVRSALGHGSGVGTAICEALGIDPNEMVEPEEPPEWVVEALGLDDKEASDE